MRDYEEIKRDISEAPLTFLPGLLSQAVCTCRREGVFIDDAALVVFVQQIIDRNPVVK